MCLLNYMNQKLHFLVALRTNAASLATSLCSTATNSTFCRTTNYGLPITVAARSKPWVCGHSLTGIAGSNPAWA